ncbi:MAG: translation initiation factor IF-2 [Chloroflexota bacterium]|nr:translation initiation factor IF-2 [Chloroflexota bacterium]
MAEASKIVLVPDYLTVRELAELIDSSPIDVMKTLISNGIMASINQQIDFDTAAIVVEELGFSAQSASAVAAAHEEEKRAEQREEKWSAMYAGEAPEALARRPPIITILGHVDHGKTTLLDTIRKTAVAEGEAGGITQHIGAYQAQHAGHTITFLDTPGHEAFTAMRARGAQGADIAILVVAADDGVMPTTREALDHARAANVPLVVAITKVDRANANPDLVKQQLADLDLIPDDWDGSTIMVPVNSLAGEGVEDLLEALVLVADENQIVANPKGRLRGSVIEAEVDRSKGTMATLLVMNGTMQRGDAIVAGTAYGRIKAMFDSAGKVVKRADPSTPVAVLGLDSPPAPGVMFEITVNEKTARRVAEDRREAERARDVDGQVQPSMTLEDFLQQFQTGAAKELSIILKTDVQGSIQPITDELVNISERNEEGIAVRVLRQEVGRITESDVMLASASKAIIFGFNVSVDIAAQASADVQGVEIRRYNIIYKLFEDIELALHGMLEPKFVNRVIGESEVLQTFRIPRSGVIAGSIIRKGEARRNAKARVKRGDKTIHNNVSVSSLKRFQDDVREVRTGFECGIGLDGVSDFEEGDVIEFFVRERVT